MHLVPAGEAGEGEAADQAGADAPSPIAEPEGEQPA